MNRFLIAGCQRSGTTLMRLLLGSHSEIACIDEILSYEVLAGTRSSTVNDVTGGLTGFKIPVWTEQLADPVLRANELAWLCGFADVPNFYSGEKIVFMVRDPLDTVYSMMTLRLSPQATWMERVCLPLMQGFRIESADRLTASAALYWKCKTAALLKYRQAGFPVYPVIYEQLVAATAPVMQGLLSFLGVEWQDSVLQHHRRSHPQVVAGKAIGGTDPSRPVDDHSVGQGERLLTREQIEIVRSICLPLQRELA